MKKYFTIGVLFLAIMFLTWQILFAAPVTIISPDGQSQADVVVGALKTTNGPGGVNQLVGTGVLRSGSCKVMTINIKGATAGDNVIIYNDIVEPTEFINRKLEFEMGISVNNGSISLDAKGVRFTTGIYIKSSATTTLTSVVYDY